jgi:hypothetical protein
MVWLLDLSSNDDDDDDDDDDDSSASVPGEQSWERRTMAGLRLLPSASCQCQCIMTAQSARRDCR